MPYIPMPAAPITGVPWVDALLRVAARQEPVVPMAGMIQLDNPFVKQMLGLTTAFGDNPLLGPIGQRLTTDQLLHLAQKYPYVPNRAAVSLRSAEGVFPWKPNVSPSPAETSSYAELLSRLLPNISP